MPENDLNERIDIRLTLIPNFQLVAEVWTFSGTFLANATCSWANFKKASGLNRWGGGLRRRAINHSADPIMIGVPVDSQLDFVVTRLLSFG